MSKIEWIKHRRPTELDGDASGDVLTRDGLVYYTEVISGVEWIRVSEMSKKDAEIERLESENERLKQQLVVTTVNENRKLQAEVERLQAIVNEVENLHYGTDLFESCAAGEADHLIKLIQKGDE